MKMILCINSSHRGGNVRTLDFIPPKLRKYLIIATPRDQEAEYQQERKDGANLYLLPENVPQFLPAQRQFVLDHARQDFKADAVFFMDDDLKFFSRDKDLKLHKATADDMFDLWYTVWEALANYPLVGISARFGNNHVKEIEAENTRVSRCYAVDLATFHSLGVNISPFNDFVMEDFHLNLCFLEAGKPNIVFYDYAQDDIGGSNSEGGCSLYRNADAQKRSAEWLAAQHPKVVKVVEKKTKGNWAGFETDENGMVTRTDVIVRWKDAWRSKAVGGGISGFIS